MISEGAAWAIFLAPLGAFAVIGFVIRPFFNRYRYLSSLLLILALLTSLVLSGWALDSVIDNGGEALDFGTHHWLTVGDVELGIGLMVDSLTVIMLIVVVGVSLLVQVYSHGYMRDDPGYARYFAFMSLFTASMIGLVLAVNIVQLYVFWELVGLCSYLLIGFWYDRPAAAAAAKKAFIVTRIGDLGFLVAILYLFFQADEFAALGLNPFHIPDIWQAAQPVAGVLAGTALTWFALGIFSGAVGKSAQFPLHVWLPDAMEGPTPVSALIHAATMVAAGVFLVARFFPVFEVTPDAMHTVALIGAFTAIFAASMGLVANDIKRVMAYSTVSQLGYMMAALGLGAYGIAIFHLFNHAFFKALLFLGAGSVNHATGTFNMQYMGGLRKYMPWTYAAVLIGGLSLVGIFPLAGFWSKDEILRHAWDGASLVDGATFWLLAVAVFLTAVYTFRMIYLTFHGQFRGGVERELTDQGAPAPAHNGHGVHLAESPVVMVFPMVVLAASAFVSGYLANPEEGFIGIDSHWFTHFIVAPFTEGEALGGVNATLAAVTMVVAVAGIGLAIWSHRYSRVSSQVARTRPISQVVTVLVQRYYMDHLYEGGIVRRALYRTVAMAVDWFDRSVVDGVAELIGLISRNLGRAVSLLQTGQVQVYGVGIGIGVLSILVGYLIWG